MAKAAGEFTMWARNNPVGAALAARSWESINKEDLAAAAMEARRWVSLNEQDGIFDPQGKPPVQPDQQAVPNVPKPRTLLPQRGTRRAAEQLRATVRGSQREVGLPSRHHRAHGAREATPGAHGTRPNAAREPALGNLPRVGSAPLPAPGPSTVRIGETATATATASSLGTRNTGTSSQEPTRGTTSAAAAR
eukprot:14308785-Heterocapsa_arctica.AAC.1